MLLPSLPFSILNYALYVAGIEMLEIEDPGDINKLNSECHHLLPCPNNVVDDV